MQIKKALISLLLMLSYSVGIAHNFIPHQHHMAHEAKLGIEHSAQHDHHHEHHSHSVNDNVEHEHITHSNHFDESIFDFIICLFTESDHPTSEKTACTLPSLNNNLNNTWIAKAKLSIVLSKLFTSTYTEEEPTIYVDRSIRAYSVPHTTSFSLRGPPTIA